MVESQIELNKASLDWTNMEKSCKAFHINLNKELEEEENLNGIAGFFFSLADDFYYLFWKFTVL